MNNPNDKSLFNGIPDMEAIVRGSTCNSAFMKQQQPIQESEQHIDEENDNPKSEVPSIVSDDNDKKERSWQHFSLICSIDIVNRIKALSGKEGFTIRSIVEKMLGDGLNAYEQKHGPLMPVNRKIEDLF